MEAPVHVVDAVRDLVGVRHHPQVEWLRIERLNFRSNSPECSYFRIGDDGLSDSIHTQIVPTEPVSAVVCLFVLVLGDCLFSLHLITNYCIRLVLEISQCNRTTGLESVVCSSVLYYIRQGAEIESIVLMCLNAHCRGPEI